MFGAAYTLVHAGDVRAGVVPIIVLFALTRLAIRRR